MRIFPVRATRRLGGGLASQGSGFHGCRSAQGSCARRRKGHLPKVCLGRKKLERHDGLSVAPRPERHHSRFRFLFAAFVHQDESLPHGNRDVQNRQPSMPAHGNRAGADLEFLVLFIDSLYRQIGENGYAGGAAAFAAPKMKGGHARWSPLSFYESRESYCSPVTSREPSSLPVVTFGFHCQVLVRLRVVSGTFWAE